MNITPATIRGYTVYDYICNFTNIFLYQTKQYDITHTHIYMTSNYLHIKYNL